ncbi:MAG: hypothetical protein WBN39_10735, partial [Flavobacteriaceae bacterium]
MNKVRIFIFISFCLLVGHLDAQVKIGDDLNFIDPSSLLELESSTKVMVLTRLTNSEMESITPLN